MVFWVYALSSFGPAVHALAERTQALLRPMSERGTSFT